MNTKSEQLNTNNEHISIEEARAECLENSTGSLENFINKIICGDALEVLKTFPDECINCVVTSPPYWSLRDYGVDGQLGLESTFQEYLNHLIIIFDEVKRVLRKDGTCWVVIGDTYSGSGNGSNDYREEKSKSIQGIGKNKDLYKTNGIAQKITKIVPAKSLCMIPSRFAIMMIDRGFLLRNEVIWRKVNALPSSVKDRFTVDFEKVFFFTKSQKYYFEQQFEPVKQGSIERSRRAVSDKNKWINDPNGGATQKLNRPRTNINKEYKEELWGGEKSLSFLNNQTFDAAKGRNKRCVWDIPTRPFSEAHFAVFPPDLVKPMILAGCPPNGIVLDPFIGSGTTALVARALNRNYIGIDLNPKYVKIALKRLEEASGQSQINFRKWQLESEMKPDQTIQ